MKIFIPTLSLLFFTMIGSCKNSVNDFPEKISDIDKKTIISCIELVDSTYHFNSQLARERGLSSEIIARMNKEIENVNIGIQEAKKLPNSTIELIDPASLDLDSLFQVQN